MKESQSFNSVEVPDSQEEADFLEVYLETHIEAILERYRKVNEGNNGIVGLVDLRELGEEALSLIRKSSEGEDIPYQMAIKMLKIYSGTGAGIREAKMQSKASELISQSSDNNGLASVPKIYFAREVEIEETSTCERMESDGVILGDGNKAEVILMDFIEGDDFAVYLYKEVAKAHPRLRDIKERIDSGEDLSLQELLDRVSSALEFSQSADRWDAFKNRRIDNENHKKMIDYLSESGFVLDSDFVDSVHRTVSLWNSRGFNHNDLHERNIIVPKQGGIKKPVIVDFGSSTIDEAGEDVSGRDSLFLDDNYVSNVYRKLTVNSEQRKGSQAAEVFRDSEKIIIQRLSEEYTLLESELDEVLDADQNIDFEEIIKKIDIFVMQKARINPYDSSGPDRFWNLKALILHNLTIKHPNIRGKVREYIDSTMHSDKVVLKSYSVKSFLSKIRPEE